ncbi:hypothetical protein [Arthrobacter psychrolactophilus]|uniref:hypothetical protein n=1 Tax=Arthrobacter psychrolactophilus TaxID=92442 RepID=UPI000D7BEA19|nr:hypothetical protein [Arthrobacter psychrolactophilus]
MAKESAATPRSQFRAWGGLVVGLCVVVSAILRWQGEDPSWIDLALMAAGATLIVIWIAKLAALRRTHRRKVSAETR